MNEVGDEFVFAFMCANCGKMNPLEGNPNKHRSKIYGCRECRYKNEMSSVVPEPIMQDYMEWKRDDRN